MDRILAYNRQNEPLRFENIRRDGLFFRGFTPRKPEFPTQTNCRKPRFAPTVRLIGIRARIRFKVRAAKHRPARHGNGQMLRFFARLRDLKVHFRHRGVRNLNFKLVLA